MDNLHGLAVDVDIRGDVGLVAVEQQREGARSLGHACAAVDESLKTQAQLVLEGYELYLAVVELLVGEVLLGLGGDSQCAGVPYVLESRHVADRI